MKMLKIYVATSKLGIIGLPYTLRRTLNFHVHLFICWAQLRLELTLISSQLSFQIGIQILETIRRCFPPHVTYQEPGIRRKYISYTVLPPQILKHRPYYTDG